MSLAVVTGASSGIGLELSIELSNHYDIVLATIRRPNEATERRLKSKPNISVCELDVTKKESIERFFDMIHKTYEGKIDLIVNNAGIGIAGSVCTMDIEIAKQIFEVNVWGIYQICQRAFPLMKNGLIVMISSIAGIRGLPAGDVYSMSKFALQGMADSFRFSVARNNLKVITINPGPVKTPFIKRWKERDARKEAEADVHARDLTERMRTRLESRMESKIGQSAKECADEIVSIILKVREKDLRKGDVVPLVNGTSEFARGIVDDILKDPTGFESEAYKSHWEWSMSS